MITCRFCGMEPKVIVVLPYESGEDRDASPYACIPCAKERGYYCTIHNKPYVGSTCGYPFCMECVEAHVELQKERAQEICAQIMQAMSPDDQEGLREAAQLSASIVGGTEEVAVLRFVLTLAHRERIGFDKALELATSERAINHLLPIVLS